MSLKRLPHPNEVEEALSRFISSQQARDFLKTRGIFIAAKNRDYLGGFAKFLFLDYKDYEELHIMATALSDGHSISGFDIYLKDEQEEPINVGDELVFWLESGHSIQVKGENLQRVEPDVLTGHLKYSYNIPGKYELVGRIESDVEFELRAVNPYKWHLTYFPDKSTDHSQIREVISKAIGNKGTITQPQLRGLPQAKRIEFYDLFLAHNHVEWSFVDVKTVKVKEPEPEPKDDLEFDDDTISDVDSDNGRSKIETRILGSIQEAMLKGENLRTNPFVKQFEQDGYYFQSMTVRYEHKNSPIMIDIVVDFKLKPIGLEVSILQAYETVDGHVEECPVDGRWKAGILEAFWQVAHAILNDIRRNVTNTSMISTA